MRKMTVEVDMKEIKNLIATLNRKLDLLIESKGNMSLMQLAEKSLEGFLEEEPDIYTVEAVKVRYR